LTPLVWLGGLLMLVGGIICWWPERRRLRVPVKETYTAGAALANKGNGDRSVGEGTLVVARIGDVERTDLASTAHKNAASEVLLSHRQDTAATEEESTA